MLRLFAALVFMVGILACTATTEPEQKLPEGLRVDAACTLHDIQSGPGYMDAVWVCDTRAEAEDQAAACAVSGAQSTSQLPYNSVECNWVYER